jgi:Rieske Fe-S protein
MVGRPIMGPAPRPLDRFPVKVTGGHLLIRPEPVRAEHA